MLKTILVKDREDTQNHILKEYHLERNIVVKVVSIIMIILFTGCSKDINIDPVQTLSNQFIKSIMNEKKK